MAQQGKRIELGFVDQTEPQYLLSHYFPSKVGGKPAWLALEGIPQGEKLYCKNCQKTCVFLLQIYSPVENKPECFHRSLFLFACKDPICCKKNSGSNFLVFRCQLSKSNKYYSNEPPSEDHDPSQTYPNASQYQDMCIVCGGVGCKKCSKCHKATYCSKEHQTIDWKAGHKTQCDTSKVVQCNATDFLFPELELVTELEVYTEKKEDAKSDSEKMKDYQEFVTKTKELMLGEGASIDKDLNDMARHQTVSDKAFFNFKKRTEVEPHQVLRYQLKGEPLWVSNEDIPTTSDIANCKCGAERVFEFQILPHLLNHLKVDSLGNSLDWGTLAVYTCAENCDVGDAQYHEEVLWKQDFSSETI